MSALNSSVKKAFTLTELLVSLTVLGLIATLTLPHLFASFDRAKKRAVFKEAYQALAEAVHAAMLEGEPNSTILNKFNGAKTCLTNSLREGCTTFVHPESQEVGMKLATGVSIFGLNNPYYQISGNTNLTGEDGFFIGLEDFPKKEYFYLGMNLSPTPFDTRAWITGWLRTNSIPGQVYIETLIRPGEIKCIEQACLDMLKKD